MNPIYLGVDIAGAKNTWAAALSSNDNDLIVVREPWRDTLENIVKYCEENDVVALAIDAQLTIALSEDSGLRTSDRQLKELLPKDYGKWVTAINSLAAVPVRGRLLAENLSPIVGTMLETHPRASLFFGLECIKQGVSKHLQEYKRSSDDTVAKIKDREQHTRTLWQHWAEKFGIAFSGTVSHDGALDSLVCATVAYLFHRAPARLYKLRHEVPYKMGRGPFYVLSPDSQGKTC